MEAYNFKTMKVLNSIPSNRIVAIDIETVRVAENFEDLSEGFQSAWEYKNKQDGEIPEPEQLADFWVKRSSLYAEFSKVCAVSLAYLDNSNRLVCKEFYGEDEVGLLTSLGATLNNMTAYSADYRLVGHSSKFFDFPVLAKRYIINGLDIPDTLDSSGKKPWEVTNLCTNELWKLGGLGAGSSLQALCNVLNIPVSKVDLVGDEVGKAYYDGEFERIGRYCSYDTVATFNVMMRFKKQDIFKFEEVEYIKAFTGGELIKDERTVLEKLYASEELTDTIKKELEELLNKKKRTKKDMENLFTILRGVWVQTDFVNNNQDNKKVIQEKEEELKQFLEEL